MIRTGFDNGTSVQTDAATGEVIDLLDPSRRAYRWWFDALHTLDVPALAVRPLLRSVVIVLLCTRGLRSA